MFVFIDTTFIKTAHLNEWGMVGGIGPSEDSCYSLHHSLFAVVGDLKLSFAITAV